jgi:hypothetical protein
MVISSAATTAMLAIGLSIPQIFLVMAGLTGIAAWIIRGAVREQMRQNETAR